MKGKTHDEWKHPVKKTKANFLKNANLFGNPDFGAIGSTSSPYHGMGSGSFSVK